MSTKKEQKLLSIEQLGRLLAQEIGDVESRKIFKKVQDLLCFVAHDPQKVQDVSFPLDGASLPLGAVISKVLRVFHTQKVGGFEVSKNVDMSKEEMESRLAQGINNFSGLVFGVESPARVRVSDALLKEDCRPHPSSTYGEMTVYNKEVVVSKEYTTLLGFYGDSYLQEKRARIQHFLWEGVWILTGHMTSGTKKGARDRENRDSFLHFVRGCQSPQSISFWDANFDVTSYENIEELQRASKEIPFQFVIPLFRVAKKRYQQKPFQNNQILKGEGDVHEAESMIAVVPRGLAIEVVQQKHCFIPREMPLLVISDGECLVHNKREICRSAPQDLPFVSQQAFIDIWLDHIPILVRIAGKNYAFHNFMEFKGERGIGGENYKSAPLKDSEEEFWSWIQEEFSV